MRSAIAGPERNEHYPKNNVPYNEEFAHLQARPDMKHGISKTRPPMVYCTQGPSPAERNAVVEANASQGGIFMTTANLTPHISCAPEDFARTVLMPGDPLRAKFIAETYLTDRELVNDVRGVQGYTGYFEGKRVSVMASGMGMPSIGIYSYELFNIFGVERIIRVGSAGAIDPSLQLFDLVLGQGACTDSNYPGQFVSRGTFAPIADYGLLSAAAAECARRGLRHRVGNLLSSDSFYGEAGVAGTLEWRKLGVLAVEMESAALYANAARAGKQALCICTISDLVETGVVTTAQQRQTAFHDMMQVALTIA